MNQSSDSAVIASEKPIRVFVSYAREDKQWLDPAYRYNLVPYLAESLRRLQVAFWFDKELKPGDEFRRFIESEIDQSQIALLIVSQSFLNSEFIENKEMPRIAERARQGHMIVIPVLVEPCDWSEYPFLADRQMVPSSPLIDYTESDPQWAKIRFQILDGIKAQLKRIRETPQQPVPKAQTSAPEEFRSSDETGQRREAAPAPVRHEPSPSENLPPLETRAKNPSREGYGNTYLVGTLMVAICLIGCGVSWVYFGSFLPHSPILVTYGLTLAGLAIAATRKTRLWGAILSVVPILSAGLLSGWESSTLQWVVSLLGYFVLIGAVLLIFGMERRKARGTTQWVAVGRTLLRLSLLFYLLGRTWNSLELIHGPSSEFWLGPDFGKAIWAVTWVGYILCPAAVVACVCTFYRPWTRIAAICFSVVDLAIVPLFYLSWRGQLSSGDWTEMLYVWSVEIGMAGAALLLSASSRAAQIEIPEHAGLSGMGFEPMPLDPQ